MNCDRCNGLMTVIMIEDPATRDSVRALRCLLCGEVIDPVIASNRQEHRQPTKTRARLPVASHWNGGRLP